MDNNYWANMSFDPELLVNVGDLILLMQGDPMMKLTDDQWEEAKERCADVMEQFLVLRIKAESLNSNLQFYVARHNELEAHFIQTYGLAGYRAFKNKMDEQRSK